MTSHSTIALRLAGAALAMVAIGACNDRTKTPGQSTSQSTDATTDSTESTDIATNQMGDTGMLGNMMSGNNEMGTDQPMTRQAFADAVAASDRFEIESARIVESKGLTGEWRDFAQRMIRDHTNSSNQLRTAAAKVEGLEMRQQPALTSDQQDQLRQLQSADGEALRALYAQQQLAAHERAHAMLTSYADKGDARPLADFARQTAPVVQRHLDMVRKMRP